MANGPRAAHEPPGEPAGEPASSTPPPDRAAGAGRGVDGVERKRARLAAVVKAGKRIGYGALLVAIAVFAYGAATDFPRWTVGVTTGALVLCCVVLPVPIVLGYGIRAAEREERGERPFH